MDNKNDRIGFLGVGHLARCLIAGFLKSGLPPERMLLSPRGQAQAVAAEHGIGIAASNAALIDSCATVILAVRPAHAAEAVRGLPWHAGQVLISACAGVSIATLSTHSGPARVVRIMPVTAAEIGASPTVCYPAPPDVTALIEALGPVIPLGREADFEVATVSAAVYGWAQKLIQVSADWSARQGLSPQASRQLSAGIFAAAGQIVAASDEPMEDLLEHLATPGGITELGLNHLQERQVGAAWEEACGAVLARLTKS